MDSSWWISTPYTRTVQIKHANQYHYSSVNAQSHVVAYVICFVFFFLSPRGNFPYWLPHATLCKLYSRAYMGLRAQTVRFFFFASSIPTYCLVIHHNYTSPVSSSLALLVTPHPSSDGNPQYPRFWFQDNGCEDDDGSRWHIRMPLNGFINPHSGLNWLSGYLNLVSYWELSNVEQNWLNFD